MSTCNSECYGTRVETYATGHFAHTQVLIFPMRSKFRINKHGRTVITDAMTNLEAQLTKFV
jgi:hypothetical protein